MEEQKTQQLPEDFTASMRELLGDEYPEYLDSFGRNPAMAVRVNTLKISVEEFCRSCPFDLHPVPWAENGFYVTKDARVTHHPYYYAGLYYVQEPSAMVPASRLPIQEGDRVLDLCAAPGGKATELGARLKGTGLLVANDISHSRAKALLKNLELFGIKNACVCSEAPEKLSGVYGEYFDKILVDAPCSGEGMFRKDPSMLKAYRKNGPSYYRPLQERILEAAWRMLKPGGMLLYSTCTFSILENEGTILHFLESHPDMELEVIRDCPGFSQGIRLGKENLHLERCIRLFPHRIEGEGHFAALLKKSLERKERSSFHAAEEKRSKPPTPWERFSDEMLQAYPGDFDYLQIQEGLYGLPRGERPPGGIRFLRTGLFLGSCKKDRFEPSQALAMSLTPKEVKRVWNLSAEDDRIFRYLKGETLETEGEEGELPNGWVLLCADGHPLGWGKLINGTLRNKYYAGWRMEQ